MALSLAITSAGTKLFYSPNLPTDSTAAAYAAVTGWIPLGEVSNMGAFGGSVTVVQHIPVDTATVVKRSGSVNYGTMSITAARHRGADTTALITAFNARTSGSYRVDMPPQLGDKDYFTAICTSIQTEVGTADAILNSMFTLELDSPVVTVSGS